MAQISQILQRKDGSEVRIVATQCFGAGLHCSIDVYAHRRAAPDQPWQLLNDRMHPDWRKMSVDDYVKRGRSELLQSVTHGEILKLAQQLPNPNHSH